MRLRASEYMDPALKVEVSVTETSELVEFGYRERLSGVQRCACCGERLAYTEHDTPAGRGFEVWFSVVTVRSWDVECLDEEPMVETFRTHDECATDFEDAIKLHNAGLVADGAVETIATAIGTELGNAIAKIDEVAA